MAQRDELHEELLAAKIALEAWLSNGARRIEAREVLHHALLTAYAEHWPEQVPAWLPRLVAATVSVRAAEPRRFVRQRRVALEFLREKLSNEASF